MVDTTTPKLGLTKPDVGASDDTWGQKLNTNFDILDDVIFSNNEDTDNKVNKTGDTMSGALGVGVPAATPDDSSLIAAGDGNTWLGYIGGYPGEAWMEIDTFSDSPESAGGFYLSRGRGARDLAHSVVPGDKIGTLQFNDYTSGYAMSAHISAYVEDLTGRSALSFGSGHWPEGRKEHLRIRTDGQIIANDSEVVSTWGFASIAAYPYMSLIKPKDSNVGAQLEGGVGTKTDWSDVKPRWHLYMGDGVPETGTGNTGSNLTIGRFSDDGTLLGYPLQIARSNGYLSTHGYASFDAGPYDVTAGNSAFTVTKNIDDVNAVSYTFQNVGGLWGSAGGGFWRGLHLAGPQITHGGVLQYARTSFYYEYDTIVDPTKRNFCIDAGNTDAGMEHTIRLRHGNQEMFAINMSTAQFMVPVLLPADPTSNLQAATKQYVDAHAGSGGGGAFLPLTGGHLTGNLTTDGFVGIGTSVSDWPLQVQHPESLGDQGFGVAHYGDTPTASLQTYFTLNNYNDTGFGEGTYSQYARGTQDVPLAVQNLDEIGIVAAGAYDGSVFHYPASIFAAIDSTPVSGISVGMALAFKTGNGGFGVERMRIGSNGQITLFNPVPIVLPNQIPTKAYVDNAVASGGSGVEFLPLTGGTLTGSLIYNNPPTAFPIHILPQDDSFEFAVGGSYGWMELDAFNSDVQGGAGIYFSRGRGTRTAPAMVQNGDNLGYLAFSPVGFGTQAGASIAGWVDGPPAAPFVPQSLRFYTGQSDGGIERVRIDSDGTTNIHALNGGAGGVMLLAGRGEENIVLYTEPNICAIGLNCYGIPFNEFSFSASRGTPLAPAPLVKEDWIGAITFYGQDANGVQRGNAAIVGLADRDSVVDPTKALPGAIAFRTSDTGNQGIERVRIGSNGFFGIGNNFDINPMYDLFHIRQGDAINFAEMYSNGGYIEMDVASDVGFSQLSFFRSRAANTAVHTNDILGSLAFGGADGAGAFPETATINIVTDGPITPGNIPTAFTLLTGSNTLNRVERLRITSNGVSSFSGTIITSPATGGGAIEINPIAASQQSVINFRQTSAYLWQLGKHTDNSFFLFDTVASASVISIQSNGATINFGRPLVLPADPAVNNHAATKNYVDGRIATRAPLATISTLAPSGGVDGDVWYQVT